jgi:uncharacterized membrane protein YciS (DUF1049 family)
VLVIRRLIVFLAVLGVVAAALSVGASLDSRVRLRSLNAQHRNASRSSASRMGSSQLA